MSTHRPARLRFPLSRPLAAVALSSLAGLADAQSVDLAAGDPLRGRELFYDTATASGVAGLPSCSDCHGSVEARRVKIAGAPYADLSRDDAMAALSRAIGMQREMEPFRQLPPARGADLAAYLADVPRPSAAALSFAPSAVDAAVQQPVDLRHATAIDDPLDVLSVTLVDDAGGAYKLDSDACTAQRLDPAASCRVTVGFTLPAAQRESTLAGRLRFELQPVGASESFQREVALEGALDATSTPVDPPPSSEADNDTGGGAWSLGWLLALAAAAAGVGPARRRAQRP